MHPLRAREIAEAAAETDRLLRIRITAIARELGFTDELMDRWLMKSVIEAITPERTCRIILLEIREVAQAMTSESELDQAQWPVVLLTTFQQEGETAFIAAYLRLRPQDDLDDDFDDDAHIRWAQSTLYD